MAPQWLLVWVMASFLHGNAMPITFSVRLMHRFSEEMKALQFASSGGGGCRNMSDGWPDKKSMEYYEALVSGDFLRHKMKLRAPHQLLFPSHGSKTMSLGNNFGWLHYTWIDIGTPSTSFLVALDAGSDLLWVPCDCIQCAPLSASYYANL